MPDDFLADGNPPAPPLIENEREGNSRALLLNELDSVGVITKGEDGAYICSDSFFRKRTDGAVVKQKNVPQLDWKSIRCEIEKQGIAWSAVRKKKYQDALKGIPRIGQTPVAPVSASLETKVYFCLSRGIHNQHAMF